MELASGPYQVEAFQDLYHKSNISILLHLRTPLYALLAGMTMADFQGGQPCHRRL